MPSCPHVVGCPGKTWTLFNRVPLGSSRIGTFVERCRYGIGQIYFRQEKYDLAVHNFKKALSVNPRSAVLKCYLGMAYHKQGDAEGALRALQEAIIADDLNPLARYEFAAVLISLERYQEAIVELDKLKVRSASPVSRNARLLPSVDHSAQCCVGCVQDIAPREATVFFQMGRIYKKLGQADTALTHFCHALDLKPTSTDQNLIKSAIEKLHVDDDEVDDEI